MRPAAPLLLSLLPLLVACGQSGPLVLPDDPPPAASATPAAEPAEDDEKDPE
jgi:predicted small lipoprotein YifL